MASAIDDALEGALWQGWSPEEQAAAVKAAKEGTAGVTAKVPNNQLDKDAFLKLLLTQMQYQDPLNPTDDKQFLAQMAQFTALEQMQNVSKMTAQSQAFSMVGKMVGGTMYTEATGKYEDFVGVVEGIRIKNSEAYLVIGDKEVKMSQVTDVGSDYTQISLGNINKNINVDQNLSLIGRYVQAIITNSKKEMTGFIEGQVDYIKFDSSGKPVLVIGENEVDSEFVNSISGEMKLITKKIAVGEVEDPADATKKIPVLATVEKVKISDGKAYLVLKSGSAQTGDEETKEVRIRYIDVVTDALGYVTDPAKSVSYGDVSGKVIAVKIVDGLPVLITENGDISYTDMKGIKVEAEKKADDE